MIVDISFASKLIGALCSILKVEQSLQSQVFHISITAIQRNHLLRWFHSRQKTIISALHPCILLRKNNLSSKLAWLQREHDGLVHSGHLVKKLKGCPSFRWMVNVQALHLFRAHTCIPSVYTSLAIRDHRGPCGSVNFLSILTWRLFFKF